MGQNTQVQQGAAGLDPLRKTSRLQAPQVRRTADGSKTLYSAEYGQTFRSMHGAFTEALYVFHAGAVAPQLPGVSHLRVLEVGFGSGLNFLVTAAAVAKAGVTLSYTGLESRLPAAPALELLDYSLIDDVRTVSRAWLRWRRHRLPHNVSLGRYECDVLPGCWLALLIGDARRQQLPREHFDAVYLDGFSPKVNPELWSPGFLQQLHAALVPGGRLATYSAAGHVRRALQVAGFAVARRRGPPGKREVLVATKPARNHGSTIMIRPEVATFRSCPLLNRAKSGSESATTGRLRR